MISSENRFPFFGIMPQACNGPAGVTGLRLYLIIVIHHTKYRRPFSMAVIDGPASFLGRDRPDA
jgi:hypothetical protein